MTEINFFIKKVFLFFVLIVNSFSHLSAGSVYSDNLRDTVYIKQYLDRVKAIEIGRDKAQADSFLFYLNKADVLSQELNYTKYLYDIDHQYVILFTNTRNYSMALEYSFKILTSLDNHRTEKMDVETKSRYIHLYKSIGLIYYYLGNLGKSLDYLENARIFAEENYQEGNFDDEILCTIYNDIGSIYLHVEEYGIAQQNFEKALEYNKKSTDEYHTSAIYNNLGIICLELGNYDQALIYYYKALSIREKIGHKMGIAQVYNNLGRYYFIQNQYDKAIPMIKNAISLNSEAENYRSEIIGVRNLSKIYKERKDYKNEAIMNKREAELKDSIARQENTVQAAQLEIQYEYERQRKHDELNQQIALANKERTKLIFIMIAGVLAFLFLILVLFYRNLRINAKKDKLQADSLLLQQKNLELEKQNLLLQNTKLEEEIEGKNRELTTHVMYLVQKNEFINSITNKLIDFTGGDSKTITKQQLSTIIRQMKTHVDKTTWEEFEVRFQQIHQTFYVNLNEKIPNLTPNEKRLCAFLYLNMTTKEISSITFQSIKSIEVARTRLRKKMGIDRDDNLIAVLQTL